MSEISMRGAVGRSGRRVAKGAIHLQAAGRGQGPVTEENGQQSRRTLLPADTPAALHLSPQKLERPSQSKAFFHQAGAAAAPQPASFLHDKLFFTRGSTESGQWAPFPGPSSYGWAGRRAAGPQWS